MSSCLETQTVHAVGLLLAQGFGLEDIVVLTGHGLSRSALLARETLGPYSIKRFTGNYDRAGNPVWTEGQLLMESVYRYKGQSAPAVVLCRRAVRRTGQARQAVVVVAPGTYRRRSYVRAHKATLCTPNATVICAAV